MKFKNACKAPKIIKKWLADHNLSSNVCGSNLPISAVSIGPKWAFKVLQTLTSTHPVSVQTRRRSYLRPKLSGPKSVERKNTKLWNFSNFLAQRNVFESIWSRPKSFRSPFKNVFWARILLNFIILCFWAPLTSAQIVSAANMTYVVFVH